MGLKAGLVEEEEEEEGRRWPSELLDNVVANRSCGRVYV